MKPLAIYGAGGLGKEALMITNQINAAKCQWELQGFYEDDQKRSIPKGYNRLGGLNELNMLRDKIFVIMAIADPQLKHDLIAKIKNPKVDYANLIHPTVLGNNFCFGKGVMVGPYSNLGYDARVESHTFIGSHCTIGHEATIGEYCSIMPSTNISGSVKINSMVFIGVGSRILQDLSLGCSSTIGAGAVVTNSIREREVVTGIPAKPHRSNF